jgi:hypothetical protein
MVPSPRYLVHLIYPRRFEPWLYELTDRISGRPERFELCRADVTEVAMTALSKQSPTVPNEPNRPHHRMFSPKPAVGCHCRA